MIEIVSHPSDPPPARLTAILGRRAGVSADVEEAVRGILRAVCDGGDGAVVDCTARFDGVTMATEQLRVPVEAIRRAREGMAADLAEAVAAAAANIQSFHERQRQNSWFVEDGDGVILGKRRQPLRRVGICVPGGNAPLLSSLLMTAIPAQVAGVRELCVVSPPGPDGLPHPDILATAGQLGLEEFYAMGGAQAVGAMAYGTESVAPVDKIVGPGGPYTVAAKKQVYGLVGVEMIPGPSEIVVLADAGADPRFVAADLLSQAEHGSGFEASVCVTPSAELAAAVAAEVARQVPRLPLAETIARALQNYGAIVVVPDLAAGVELVNEMAPEHLELLVSDPWATMQRIENAGAIFLGPASAESVGDYFAGTNHVLPTSGAARFASSLGLDDFVKTTSIVAYTPERLAQVGGKIIRMAEAEGLQAHAEAVRVRLLDGGTTDD